MFTYLYYQIENFIYFIRETERYLIIRVEASVQSTKLQKPLWFPNDYQMFQQPSTPQSKAKLKREINGNRKHKTH